MSVKINVDPARLEASASHIEQMYMNYEREYRRLFQDVQTMGNNWQGKDNQAFVQQINGFVKDFASMRNLMKEYAEFLKESARAYRNTQNERAQQARHLIN